MHKFFILILCCVLSTNLSSQELNALVTINTEKIQSSNKQVYTTLQTALTEFLNQKQWTDKRFKVQERINCAFTIIVNEQNGNDFSASLQVQATRPVYKSSYASPILNINDLNFNFKYNEFDPLIFNPNIYESNLVSTIAFYAYVIIGIDGDTFQQNGGEAYYKQAENAMLQAQSNGESGWQNQIGKQNRFTLIDSLLSQKFSPLRNIYYNYHRNGFDKMISNIDEAKLEIEKNIIDLDKIHNITVGNYMIRVFLDAKADEIVNVFSQGKQSPNQQKMKAVLQAVSPTYENKWEKIN